MYQITCDDLVLHDLRTEDRRLINPKLTLESNKTGNLTFSIPATHPCYGKINILKSVIRVFKDGTKLFEGRALSNQKNFYNTGNIPCEGELAYLLDSIQRPYEVHDYTVMQYLQMLITNHNNSVEDNKHFILGNVTVTDSNNSLYRLNEGYINTWDEIQDKLINKLGGYLIVRYVGNVRYLDYIASYENINSQIIKFGDNILDLTQHLKGGEIKTAIIPLGKDKLTIASVNSGLDYIYNQTAVELYGWIYGTVEFNDVTVASNLKSKGQEYLNNCINLALTIELSAIDLNLIDVNIESIKVGDWIRVLSKPHNLDRLFLVTKLDVDLSNPSNNKITLGDTLKGLTEKQINANKAIKNSVVIKTEGILSEINTVDGKISATNNTVTRQQKYIIMGV
jgi:hypothetical protein